MKVLKLINTRKSALKALALFCCLFTLCSLTSLQAQRGGSQTLPDVGYKLQPHRSSGFISWNNQTSLEVDAWQISVYRRTFDPQGNGTTTTIFQTVESKKFYQLDQSFLDDADLYYQVNGLNAAGQIIVIGDVDRLCPGCGDFDLMCKYKCNGTDYAWELNVYEETGSNARYLGLSSTEEYYNANLSVGVPYYRYMDMNEYNAWEQANPDWQNYEIIHISNLVDGPYLNMQGNVITNLPIKGVGKRLEQYNAAPFTSSTLQQSAYPCNNTRTNTINMFNWYSDNTLNLRPLLDCQPTPGLPTGDGVSHEYDSIPDDLDTLYIHVLGPSGIFGEDGKLWWDGSVNPGSGNSIPLFTGFAQDDTEYFDDDNDGVDFPVSKFREFQLYRIDGDMTPITISASDVFLGRGATDEPKLTLEDGLYRLDVIMRDGRRLPIYSELTNMGSNTSQTQADLATVVVYPVPVVGNTYSADITTTVSGQVTYKVEDLNGNQLFATSVPMDKYVTRTVPVTLNLQGPVPYGMLVNKFIMPDGSVKYVSVIQQ